MATRHFIADFQLALLGDIYFGQFYNTGRQFIPHLNGESLALELTGNLVALQVVILHHPHNE